jgi:hypothetical protein
MSIKPLPASLGRCQSNQLAAPSAIVRIAIVQLKTNSGWRPRCMSPSIRSGTDCVQNH